MSSTLAPREAFSHLSRLAQMGANMVDAFSCFILMPESILSEAGQATTKPQQLRLLGSHSLSQDVVEEARIPADSGLLGWVATHRRSIHVSPFEHDSRTLGVYQQDQSLKSFLGIPILLESPNNASSSNAKEKGVGVLACDSKKSFAFSKLQGKLLEELAVEIGAVVNLYRDRSQHSQEETSWQHFVAKTEQLSAALGSRSLEVMRITPLQWDVWESVMGTQAYLQLVEQYYRLLYQSLPPHLPFFKLPLGDAILVLDNMTTAFYESRVRALCEHIAGSISSKGLAQNPPQKHVGAPKLEVLIRRASMQDPRSRSKTILDLVRETAQFEPQLVNETTATTNASAVNFEAQRFLRLGEGRS